MWQKASGTMKKQLLNDRKSKIGKNGMSIRHDDFLALDGNVIRRALSSDMIEWVADGANKFVSNNETLYKKRQVYKPIFPNDQFYVKVDGILSDLDEWYYFNIKLNSDWIQCLDIATKNLVGWQFRVEQVESDWQYASCSVIHILGNNRGLQGQQGIKWDKPNHTWSGTSLSFENPDNTPWPSVNIKGDKWDKWDKWDTGATGATGWVWPIGNTGATGWVWPQWPIGLTGTWLIARWVYDNSTTYNINDYVSYSWSSYSCIATSLWVPPVSDPMSPAKWILLVQKWDTGNMWLMWPQWPIGNTGATWPQWNPWATWPQGSAWPLINEFAQYWRTNNQSIAVGVSWLSVWVIDYDSARWPNSAVIQSANPKQYMTCAFTWEHEVNVMAQIESSFSGIDTMDALVRLEIYATDSTWVVKWW
jgi:hypothetical protein